MKKNKKDNVSDIYDFREYTDIEEEDDREIDVEEAFDVEDVSKKPKLKIFVIFIVSITIIIFLANYTANQEFRNYIDMEILGKQVIENSLTKIEINSEDNPISFSYEDYIGVFAKNKLTIYNSKAAIINELSINVTNPIIETNGKYIVIAEKDGNKFYVVNNTDLIWQSKVDGNIFNINVNENGYVSVIVSNSTYTSIVLLFNSNGEELFKKFLRSTYAMCSSVSTNNSCLAIGEIDYSGTVLKSNIRIMSVNSAEEVYNYTTDNIITNIEYYDKEKATCSFTDNIVSVSTNDFKEIYKATDDTYFMDIAVYGLLSVLEKQSSGLFSYNYNLKLISLNSSTENLYILNSLPQQMVASSKNIALNYGNKVDIINLKGALKKNYTSNQQIKGVILGSSVAGIVYKDKIEIIEI